MATIRVVATGRLPGGETWVNVFHFAGLDANSAHAAAREKVKTFYLAIQNTTGSGWALERLVSYWVTGQGAGLVAAPRGEVGENLAGTSGGANMPNEVSLVISWQTALPGRSGRGRTYLAGFTEGGNTGAASEPARPEPNVVTVIVPAAEGLATAGAEVSLVVFSQKNGTEALVTGGYVNDEWDTQRRRARSLTRFKTTFSA